MYNNNNNKNTVRKKEGREGLYHIGESKAMDTSFTEHGNESPGDIIRIKEVPGPAVG